MIFGDLIGNDGSFVTLNGVNHSNGDFATVYLSTFGCFLRYIRITDGGSS